MMRLTLRTLLAYLDDVLSPADTKLIGQKIHESPMAQLLVSRIREVMRRRRLKAPEVFGPEMGIDPNVVSQYLDNTLPMEQYADVERVLLASDELLAETASCHQVLTLILGDSKEVPLASRERLYALGPVDSSGKLSLGSDTSLTMKSKTPESVPVKADTIAASKASVRPADPKVARPTEVPEYLKPTPIIQQLIPAAVVVFLLAICIGLAIPLLNEGLEQARTEINQKNLKQTARHGDKSSTEADSVVALDKSADASGESIAASEPVEKTPSATPQGDPERRPESDTELPSAASYTGERASSKKPGSNNDAIEVPSVSAVDIATKPPQTNPTETPSTSIPPSPDSNTQVDLTAQSMLDLKVSYVSTDGVLIRMEPDQRRWFVVPRSTELNPAERIANLEPFDSQLSFEKSGLRVTLVNDCVVELLPPSAAGRQGLGIGRGRVIMKAIAGERPLTPFAIAIGEDLWKLEFLNDETECAIEVAIREPVGFEKVNPVRWYQASFLTLSGAAKLTTRSGRSVELTELAGIELAPEKADIARPVPVTVLAEPEWTQLAKRKAQPLRNYQSPFEKAFVPNLTVEDSMLTLVLSTKNPKIAELGAKCLSATDDYTAMVQTFAECEHQEGQAAARDGLRQWLPMNSENGNRLKAALSLHYQDEDAEAVYRMLWGFSREEIQSSKSESLRFTSWMRSQRREVRKLADYWVERLTGRTNEFNAYGTEPQRDSQIRRIEEQIERNGGLKWIERNQGQKKAF